MAVSHYMKEIGRGKQGARPLSREQAADLFGQLLDGAVTDLEVGAFCLAMRIKGETPEEVAGFLDATYAGCVSFPRAPSPWWCCRATTARASSPYSHRCSSCWSRAEACPG